MKKNIYTAPMVEVLECKVEKGFAGSGEWHPTAGPLEPVTPQGNEEYQFS